MAGSQRPAYQRALARLLPSARGWAIGLPFAFLLVFFMLPFLGPVMYGPVCHIYSRIKLLRNSFWLFLVECFVLFRYFPVSK
jgi:hypothetical protein